MSDTLREDIIKSEAAERMLNTVSPIYDNSYVGLWMFEAIGREYDILLSLIESLKTELFPDTATWMLELWEKRYGLAVNPSLSKEERRRRIKLKQTPGGAFNPRKVENLAEAVTGFSARVEENIAPYTFAVYLTTTGTNDEGLRRSLNRVKPSHLSFVILYEESVTGEFMTGIGMQSYKHFELQQVN